MKHSILILALAACVACEPIDPTPKKPTAPAVPNVCNANELQGLVGQPKKAMDPSAFKTEIVRILFAKSAVTLDYNEDRLNIVVNKDDIITRVACG